MAKKIPVVTWTDPRGGNINLCHNCESISVQIKKWVRNWAGEEYKTLTRGTHSGECGHPMHGKPMKVWTEQE